MAIVSNSEISEISSAQNKDLGPCNLYLKNYNSEP